MLLRIKNTHFNPITTMKDFLFKPKPQSGFFDLPNNNICNHPQHNPPTHIYIPPGKGYKHVCPKCNKERIMLPSNITF